MTSYKLVMPGDLNHYGFLFGGKTDITFVRVDKDGAKLSVADC